MRRIRILADARQDLVFGYWFYEQQAAGIGRYFLDTLYSDIESLRISAGVHSICFDHYHRLLSNGIKFNSGFQWPRTSRHARDGNVEHITESLSESWRLETRGAMEFLPV